MYPVSPSKIVLFQTIQFSISTATSDRNAESCNRIPSNYCLLSHHVFDQVNLWPAWVGFETAIFWQCSPGTAETHGTRRAIKDEFFWSYKSLSSLPESGTNRIFVLVFNWNHFEMRFLNLRLNFYFLRTFFPHLGRFFFCVVSSFITFRPNFTSGFLRVIYRDLG